MKITKSDLVELISGTFDAEYGDHPIHPTAVVERTVEWLLKMDLIREDQFKPEEDEADLTPSSAKGGLPIQNPMGL